MASSRAIAVALGTFAETFPTREVSPRTADVWSKVMSSVPDEVLDRAVLRLCRDPERRFFPSSGEVFAAIADDARPVDVLNIIHRIEKLGFYDPPRGWVYPKYETVRDALGDEIAKAYAVAGAATIFSDDLKDGSSVTRDIARRSFGSELERVNKATPERLALPPAALNLLPAIAPSRVELPRLLTPGQPAPLLSTLTKIVEKCSGEAESQDTAA